MRSREALPSQRLSAMVARHLGLIEKSADVETLARSVKDNGGVYFVPAFSGLYAPYWKTSARGVIAGLTRYANKGHLLEQSSKQRLSKLVKSWRPWLWIRESSSTCFARMVA